MDELKGLTVVSVEHAVAAPFASMKLADAGARVIKVERPEGDFARDYDALAQGQSSYFVWLNRGKESVALDLKDPRDASLLRSMIAKADVVIQNLGPGAMERLGLGGDELLARHPRLILCSISGYGSEGPRAGQKAYDLLIQAESGLCGITGTPDGPARVGISVCDIAAGMTAYQAILEALIGRGITGRGRHIEVSLFSAMADWMNVPYLQRRLGGVTPGRHGLRHPTIAPYGAFPCADGRVLLIAVQNDREWAALCSLFHELPPKGFETNSARVANRAALEAWVGERLARLPLDVAAERLDAARIAYGRLSSLDDLADHPSARFATIQTPSGTIEILAPGVQVKGEAARALGAVPALDAHGAALRAEFATPATTGTPP